MILGLDRSLPAILQSSKGRLPLPDIIRTLRFTAPVVVLLLAIAGTFALPGTRPVSDVYMVVALAVTSGGSSLLLGVMLIASRRWTYAISRVSLFGMTSVCSLTALLLGYTRVDHLILAQIIGNIFFLATFFREAFSHAAHEHSLLSSRELFRHGTAALPYSLLALARDHLDKFALAAGFGVTAVGYYVSAQAFATLAVVSANSLSASMSAQIARTGLDNAKPLNLAVALLLALLPISIGAVAFASPLFGFVYGPEFAPAAALAPVILASAAFAGARGLLTTGLLLSNRRLSAVIVEAASASVTLLIIFIGSGFLTLGATLYVILGWQLAIFCGTAGLMNHTAPIGGSD